MVYCRWHGTHLGAISSAVLAAQRGGREEVGRGVGFQHATRAVVSHHPGAAERASAVCRSVTKTQSSISVLKYKLNNSWDIFILYMLKNLTNDTSAYNICLSLAMHNTVYHSWSLTGIHCSIYAFKLNMTIVNYIFTVYILNFFKGIKCSY